MNSSLRQIKLECAFCDAEFTVNCRTQKYCSKACKEKAADKRHRRASAEKLKEKSRLYYQANKEKWGRYKENYRQKIETDPEAAARARLLHIEDNVKYNKAHPGMRSLQREAKRDRENPDRHRRILPDRETTLLAASRLVAKQAKRSDETEEGQRERKILMEAAFILTARAGEIIIDRARARNLK